MSDFNLQNQVLSVTQFNQLINEIVSPLQVLVEGELVQIRINSGRWFFATLKDDQASVEIFSLLTKISNWQTLQEGMKVRVSANPRIYQKTGKFSLFALTITPAGRGALKEALEKLKEDLSTLGYFLPERKRPLPRFIRKIGLITASGSRAYSDFVAVLGDQPAGIEVDFYPVLVQGDEAITQIKLALNFFNRRAKDYDLLVLTRGGGSLEDLLPFNSKALAEAVYGSSVPILAAIGHEEDDCLIDLVADVRAPTPTGAAQIINGQNQRVLVDINDLSKLIVNQYQQAILNEQRAVASLTGSLLFYYQKQISEVNLLLGRFGRTINTCESWLKTKRETLSGLKKLLSSLDYRNILKRGFTLTINDRGKIITSPENVFLNDQIVTRFYRGEVVSQVKLKQ